MSIVYYDLKNSPFTYKRNELELFFSSEFKKRTFKNRIDEYLENEKAKINSKYRANILFEDVLILNYYKICEKKGFYATYKGKELNTNYTIKAEIEV